MMSNIRETSQQDRRVYVGNLSYDVKWHHLKDFMRQGRSLLSFISFRLQCFCLPFSVAEQSQLCQANKWQYSLRAYSGTW